MVRKNLLKGLTLPKKIDFSVEKEEGRYGEYAKMVAYPFERGFGTTIGNTLRRVLLSSIQGFAVSAVMFNCREDGKTRLITNEFESLTGVKEDLLEIIANIKKLQIRGEGDNTDSSQFIIKCKGPGKITGKDFEKNNFIITNPDLLIMTMESDVDIDLEVQVDFGRGYIPSNLQKQYQEQPGVIAIDSLFSPVVRVNYSVEPTRVGQRNDFDKLTMEVFTNGTISAKDAIAQAAFITQTFLQNFVNFDDKEVLKAEDLDSEDDGKKALLASPIDRLGIGSRSRDCLKRAGITLISELVVKTEDELLGGKNFGPKSLAEIKEKLESLGLELGMTLSDTSFRDI